MNSSPASSAMRVIATISSHSARHRSGARLIVSPPSQFALNTPSLNRFAPNNGLLARDGCTLNPAELAHRAVELRKIDVLVGIQPNPVHVEGTGMWFVAGEVRQLAPILAPDRNPV